MTEEELHMDALKLIQYVWALPMTILGLLVSLVYLPRGVRLRDGAIEIEVVWLPGGLFGQAIGCVVMFGPGHHAQTIIHEHVHVRQALEWGPLHPIAYLVASLWALLSGGSAYKDNVFERQARKEAGQD